jgi:hypothetical protein
MKTKNTVLSSILEQTEDFRANVLEQQIAYIEKETERKCTARDIEHLKIGMIYDVAKSIGKYVVDTDVLVGERSVSINQGLMTISANIQRDGDIVPFTTDVIFAGGYNIQRLHIRYIVKTALSRIGESEDAKEINEQIKRMKKEDRIMEDIAREEKGIHKCEAYIIGHDGLTDEQLFDLHVEKSYTNPSSNMYDILVGTYCWDKMEDSIKQQCWGGCEASFDSEMLSQEWERGVERVQREIIRRNSCIITHRKKIAKHQQKLQVLLEQAA